MRNKETVYNLYADILERILNPKNTPNLSNFNKNLDGNLESN